MNHARLSKVYSLKDLEHEIIGSAEMIEDKLQIKVDTIAYPFGNMHSIDARAVKIIEKRYVRCFSGLRGNNYNNGEKLIQWRDTIHSPWSLEHIAFLLRGGFDWYYFMKRVKLQNIADAVQ